ncbi:OmpA family protein [Alteriqipengyuania sp. WL0013]|uniref:OmpA family protein n=1 Tax=Alteriqipengyuania sp. WL0013 TaxID=3110773 RepID=UPI002B64E61B|nr:OmpA family protein [Alteriqipengyuania sp. WL0013]MEB3416416.1 OmpA family protein [Alteriqipengyuania sp. WL0013]
MRSKTFHALLLGGAAMTLPGLAAAQTMGDDLLALDGDQLRDALEMRYDAGLAASENPAIVGADDPRYLWALETKVQCGIAIGYTKSGTKDAPSIRKCALAYEMMQRVPRVVIDDEVEEEVVVERPECENSATSSIYFEWDSAVVPASAAANLRGLVSQAQACGWTRFSVVGHTDTSGSDAYNDALSLDRANAVAGDMAELGIGMDRMAVSARGENDLQKSTADGVREPDNRRVVVTAQ